MAITRSKGSRLEVDESIASLIVARLPDIRDRLALACVSKVWRLAAGSPGCLGLHNDSLVVEGALADKLPIDAAGAPAANTRVWQLMAYAGRGIRVLEIHSSGLKSLTFSTADRKYLVDGSYWGKVIKRPSYLTGIPTMADPSRTAIDQWRKYGCVPPVQFPIGYHLWTHLQVLDLRGCELLSVNDEVSYFLAEVTKIHTRPKEQRLDRLMLGGCDLVGLTEYDLTSDLFGLSLWQYVRHEPDVEKSLQAPFDLCPCTGCRRVIGEGGQCKCCKHPYCMSCDYAFERVPLCDFCDQDFLCGEACFGGEGPFMTCDSCELMFCEGCSQKEEVPMVLICVGSDDHEGCFKRMCEVCERNQDEVCFIGCDECEGFWCDSCDKAPPLNFCDWKGCTKVSCEDCETSPFAAVAMTYTAEIARSGLAGYTANAAIRNTAPRALRSITNARKYTSTSRLHHKIRRINSNFEPRRPAAPSPTVPTPVGTTSACNTIPLIKRRHVIQFLSSSDGM